MKLEKVVSRPKTGLYVFLFVVGIAVAGVMATSYNVEIIIHNLKTNVPADLQQLPWPKIILGSLGFIGIIFSLVVFFTRMIREMKISQFHADFLDRISHELRTPLSTMTLVTDLLKSSHELTVVERDRLWKSHDLELNRLKTDVESLLQAARLRESRHQVNYVIIDLQEFLADKKQSFETLLGPGAQLTQHSNLCAVPIRVDPNLFELILRNLLDNAKKFSLGDPVVELVARCNKKRFEISVRDHGLGFEPEKTKELFKRFSRIEPNANQFREFAIPGTGLGLYLSASASRAMGMTLTGTSLGQGKGAEFVLKRGYRDMIPVTTSPSVLLVEDERALADTLMLSLEKLRYQCTWAKNLREARERLSRSSFDFWILDRNLPDGDGMRLLAENPGRSARVLILSAKSEVADKITGLKAGADDYLSKPFSFAELSARLEVLSRRSPQASTALAEPIKKTAGADRSTALWALHNDTLEVIAPTGKVQLTPLEFKFLAYLIEREGTIVSKDRLLKDVWGFTFLPKTRTVDYVLTQLRKRLETEPETPAHLHTIRGAGLKFTR